MSQLHRQEKDQFKKLFQQRNIDNFEDRYKILEAFLQTERHVTVRDLIEILHQDGIRFEPEFVRETLKMMCRFGFAQKQSFDDRAPRYEHKHLAQHHDHMICTTCGKIIEFEDQRLEKLQVQATARQGFHMLQHRLEIYGICRECIEGQAKRSILSATKQGEWVIIKEMAGGPSARLRLLTMGLRVGDTIEVLINQDRGQMVITAEGKRYVLGRGLAQKILVEPLSTKGE